MGILGKIFGTGDVISKGMDLIDSMHTSDQEEIEAKTKAKTDLLSAYAPFKIAQRVLAFGFCGVFLTAFLICLGVVLFEFFTAGAAAAVDAATAGGKASIVTAIKALMSAFKIEWAVIAIVSFYFGGGAFEGFQEKKAERDKINKSRPSTPR